MISTVLLIYSLFIEIPFTTTYAEPGSSGVLVTTGTYALVRHPGVLWFGFWLLGWVLVSHRRLVLQGGTIWLLLDIALVALEEKFFFGKMFPGYSSYQQTTPMLMPTPKSLARCLRTWPGLGKGKPTW